MKERWIGIAALALVGAARAEVLTIPGSGSPEFLLRELAAAFNARGGDEIRVPPSIGSSSGIRAVESGAAILARVARPLKPGEAASGLCYLGFARDPVVFAVGALVDIVQLSAPQAADIFAGRIISWRGVGGGDLPIRVVIREPGDASRTAIEQGLPLFRNLPYGESAKLVNHDYEMVGMLDRFGTGIGFLPRSVLLSAKTAVKPLALDGTAATAANVAAGKYRLSADYGLVYRDGQLPGLARRFVDFVYSAAGRGVLEKIGATPLPPSGCSR